MKSPISGISLQAAAVFFLPAVLFASPMVEIDNIDAKLGDVIEGQVTSAKYVFKLKNTGDSVLQIINVRPG
jgi:hypothetical protein